MEILVHRFLASTSEVMQQQVSDFIALLPLHSRVLEKKERKKELCISVVESLRYPVIANNDPHADQYISHYLLLSRIFRTGLALTSN